MSPHSASSSNNPDFPPSGDNFQRLVSQAYWYDVSEKTGVKYGPTFKGLDGISTALTQHEAIASIAASKHSETYIRHRITIDQCLQIVMVAACKGQGRSLTEFSIVTAIEHLIVFSVRDWRNGRKEQIGWCDGGCICHIWRPSSSTLDKTLRNLFGA